jgi:hypothetical protein
MAFELLTELVNKVHIPLVKDEIIILSAPAEGQVPNGTANQVNLNPLPFRDGGKGHQYSIPMDSFDDFLEFEHST